MIVPGGLGVQMAKVEALNKIPIPRDVPRSRVFLGLANYYNRFVRNFSVIAKPLTQLTRMGQDWKWGPAQDWSMLGLGAVLTQKDDDGKEYGIAYASWSNNDAEAKYSSYEGECLAVVWAVAHFRPYLYDQSFTLVTDHQPLKCLMELDKLVGK